MSDARDAARRRVRELARSFVDRGDATGWFEAIYDQANGDPRTVPWADGVASPFLTEWLEAPERRKTPLWGRALVVGCGLGDDAEELARYVDLEVVAIDVAPSAIAWCRRRFPDSRVDYRVADLLALPDDLRGAFSFVFESATLQALDASVRRRALAAVASTVAPKGTLLVVARTRPEEALIEGPPWPLTRAELEGFVEEGLTEVRFEAIDDAGVARARVEYRR